ncbi:hypothetical protein JRI60_36115 [Archangium violaceum]|uniref:hypothetical protein n=1 Tax=Archangium violaceum TaxID=83451 RepID=UPI00194F0054|nr:hypothetical protein [Archangium violaceum]QRN94516.1 hypothetical protein JRI60_36115 [Archangium violaceum]
MEPYRNALVRVLYEEARTYEQRAHFAGVDERLFGDVAGTAPLDLRMGRASNSPSHDAAAQPELHGIQPRFE